MFPDISLLCGTTVPGGVPSPASKTSIAFEQAFSDLLGLVDAPASTGPGTIESFVAPGPTASKDVTVDAAAAEPPRVARAPFQPAADVPADAEPLHNIRAEQHAPAVDEGATDDAADWDEHTRGEDLTVISAVVPFHPMDIPAAAPEQLSAPALVNELDAKEPDVKELDVDPTHASYHAVNNSVEAPASPGMPTRISPDFPVELRSIADTSPVLDAMPTTPVPDAEDDSPHLIAALRRAAAQAPAVRTEPPRRPSSELPRHVSEPERSVVTDPVLPPVFSPAPRSQARSVESGIELPVAPGDPPEVPLAAKILDVISSRGSMRPSSSSPAPTSAPEPVVEQDLQAVMSVGKPSGRDAGPSPALQISLPALKSAIPVILNAAGQVRPASVTLPNEAAAAHSIVQTLRLQAANGGGTAVITLTPKYLGAVTVSLRVSEGGVTATLQAENASVRTWIESNAPLLKDGLAERGLTLTEMVVAEPYEPRRQMEDQPRRHAEERGPVRRPRRREEKGFDVLV